jgi:hypothetical protein
MSEGGCSSVREQQTDAESAEPPSLKCVRWIALHLLQTKQAT